MAALLLASCAETKYVPEGAYLLDGVKVQLAEKSYVDEETGETKVYKDLNTGQLKNYVRQRGNARWFSLFKLPLHAYSLSGRDTTKWVNRLLKNIGEPPVLLDTALTRQSCNDLQTAMRNIGYLNAEVDMEARVKGKKVTAVFKLHPHKPYTIGRVDYRIDDPQIRQLLALGDSSQWGIRPGQQFSVVLLDQERKRLTQLLTDRGYFRFHKDNITFLADSSARSRQIDVTLWLHPYSRNNRKDTLHSRYKIANVRFESGMPGDTAIHLRRHILQECSHIDAGDFYSATALRNTYNHFGRLGAVRYTNISFAERADTALLDCVIQLQNNKPSTLSFQPEGTNTAGDLGAAASLTYQNRNLFRGSENLSIELRGAYEAIRGLEGYSNQDFVEYSLETRLQFPRMISPFLTRHVRQQMNATSEVSLLYDLQNRPEFHRRLVSAAWRYKWQSQQNRRHQYQLDLLDLNYVFMPWISETFRRLYLDDVSSRNAILRYNYEDMFITKIGFGYSFNDGLTAVKANLETSGNILNAVSGLSGADRDSKGQYRVFNIAYAQYVKADVDLTRSLRLDYNNQIVFHLGLGIAYPYGNSTVLPFEKRYFSGGANSVRGWSVRRLGPGKFKGRDGRIDFINQTGDMKLDLNAEYRTHLFWKIGGALFVDAGNIWTLREYSNQPGGQFRLSNMLRELAVSYGVGLRFNFDYFIVRFDLGMKAVNPAYEEEEDEHYPLLHPRFSRDYAFHFAVGLPF
jgi:outer membrane protein assembly factor BamA